nr:MAG TPA: hypothetical protein [Caudoviricetes sp.]
MSLRFDTARPYMIGYMLIPCNLIYSLVLFYV